MREQGVVTLWPGRLTGALQGRHIFLGGRGADPDNLLV